MAKTTIADRKKALQEQLAKLEAEEKQQSEKRYLIIGRAFDTAMQNDDNIKTNCMELLDKNITKNADRAVLGLPKLETNRGRPTTDKA